jgi:hypothetical protein
MSRWMTAWSPLLRNASSTELMAAMPELNSRPSSAPSRAQSFSVTAFWLGVL